MIKNWNLLSFCYQKEIGFQDYCRLTSPIFSTVDHWPNFAAREVHIIKWSAAHLITYSPAVIKNLIDGRNFPAVTIHLKILLLKVNVKICTNLEVASLIFWQRILKSQYIQSSRLKDSNFFVVGENHISLSKNLINCDKNSRWNDGAILSGLDEDLN